MVAYGLASLIVIGVGAWVGYGLFPRNPLTALLTFIIVTLTQISLVTLLLGILQILTPLNLVLGSFVLGAFLISLTSSGRLRTIRNFRPSLSQSSGHLELNRLGLLAVLGLAVILVIPFLPLINDLVIQVLNVHPLSWDVVSYHLPNTVEYLQTNSLWTLKGAFSQYPGGNELLLLWSFVTLRGDGMLGLTTLTLGLGLMLAVTLILQRCIPVKNPILGSLQIVALWLLCFAIPDWQTLWFDVGRNDLTLGFWLTLSIWTFTQALENKPSRPAWLMWTGINLGLAMGTKPNGLYFWLGFFILSLCPIFAGPNERGNFKLKLWQRFQALGLPAILISGFWYGRNWWVKGRIFDPDILRPGAELTILRNLTNPQLYQVNVPFLVFVAAIIITVISLGISIKSSSKVSPVFRLLAWVNVIGIGAWVLTPHGAGYWMGEQRIIDLQLRYAVTLVPISVILLITLFTITLRSVQDQFLSRSSSFFQRFQKFYQPAQARSSQLTLIAASGVTCIVIGIQLLTFQPALGLPGYSHILFNPALKQANIPPSQVYEWIYKNIQNSRIYNLGLRPYGLYGVSLTNQVIDGGSPQAWKVETLPQILKNDQPDLIVISVDPFTGQVSPDIRYFFNHPKQFNVVYQDALAAVIRVKPEIQ